METLALIIALVALVIAVAAYTRTGGIRDLRHQVQTLSTTTDSVRDRTADALGRLEHLIRGRERPGPGGPPEAGGPSAPPAGPANP